MEASMPNNTIQGQALSQGAKPSAKDREMAQYFVSGRPSLEPLGYLRVYSADKENSGRYGPT